MRKATLVALAVLAWSPVAAAEEPAAQSAPAAPEPGIQLTTLRILHDKNILSDKEYESALHDLRDTSGARAAESNSVVLGKWATTLYGFVEADSIYDSTQSLNDIAGNAQIARPGTYAASHGRVQFGVRNSRIGLRVKAPSFNGIRVSAVAEMDFLGTQLPIGYGQPYYGTEAAFFTNPTFRVRHMYMKAETDVVDLLFGQTWQLFGWQNAYHPNTVEIQGVPGDIYSRTPQIRISKAIKSEPVTVEMAVAALRPPQRNSAAPEGQAGLRIAFNGWKGVETLGATGTDVAPLSVAVTGDLRHIDVPDLAAAPTNSVGGNATAGAVDAFVPIIPGSKEHMGNSLSLNGEFVSGYGIADLYTGLTGGVTFPALPNPTGASPAPTYPQDIDNGIATFASNGALHFIQWTSYLVGLQYYLPGLNGHVWVSANMSHIQSDNTGTYFPGSTKVRHAETWGDANLFMDVTPALRLGFEYARFDDEYVDGTHGTNDRGQFSAFYVY